LNNIISKLKKDKEQMTEDTQNLTDKYDLLKEEVNAKNYQINDCKEKVNEFQARLLKTQHDLQSSQGDVINLEKELQLSKETYEELKEKIKVIKFSLTHSPHLQLILIKFSLSLSLFRLISRQQHKLKS
jgi:uncharacterized protein YoxC